jgi:uncharacterized protein
MDVTPLIPEGLQIIQSYSAAGFRISGQRYTQAIFVTPEKTQVWTDKKNIEELESRDFLILEEDTSDIILIGTGTTFCFLPTPLQKSLREKGIKPDMMDSGAACRTYNVLMAEGRRVAVFLMPLLTSE